MHLDHATRKGRRKAHFLFCTDDGYVNYVLATIISLRSAQDPLLELEIFVAHEGAPPRILAEKTAHLAGVEIRFLKIDLNDPRLGAYASKNVPSSVYLRIFAIDLLPPEVEKILYLDGDILVRGAVDELFETRFSGPVAAVPDKSEQYLIDRTDWSFITQKTGIGRITSYFNSGVMLIQPHEWRSQSVTSRCAKVMTLGKFRIYDQDILNIALEGKFHRLDSKWNFTRHFWSDRIVDALIPEYDRESKDIRVLHFIEKPKPWQKGYAGPYADSYRRFFLDTLKLPLSDSETPGLARRYRHLMCGIFFRLHAEELNRRAQGGAGPISKLKLDFLKVCVVLLGGWRRFAKPSWILP